MKNKRFIYKSLSVLLLTGISYGAISCNNSNLEDVQNTGTFDSDNYFKNEEQSFSGLVAVYDMLRKYSGGFENEVTFFNGASDDFFSGGGSSTDGAGIQGFSNYTINPIIMPLSYWKDYYQGIAKANLLLDRIPNANMNDQTRKRFIAEAKVLRSLYYFELLRMFKNIPLILKPILANDDFYNIPQANPADVYAQIESDIVSAINDLPLSIPSSNKSEVGRITQGSARAILGKIYLYDKKNTEAAAQFAMVNGDPGTTSQYGYKLVANFADLWKVDNKFTTESILEVMHTNKSNADWPFWGTGKDEGNTINQMVGIISYGRIVPPAGSPPNNAPDLSSGWGFNPATEDLFNFMQGDPRLDATIFNAKQLKADNKISYSPGFKDTGYFLNKYVPRTADKSNQPGPTELNYRQNFIAIRLADTYLMEAEALGGSGARAQALLDAVRARVGLASVPVSMQAIKDERRRELAGEGHRWFDLVRWGDAPAKLGARGFTAGKNEILPIPFNELVNTALKQNPGY
ncbi:RagB/SusD family nutrient uptake outer membrane protein [Chryseobacterium daecheongense]|uniref:RagB/SusD family nutrient uptake outer membrane protein n=1 Tax=Chryseobacterium sp. LAM-KRS1 TaxID=2715754 RepID=UPI0015560B97|nr:RagB/SusD family nutrient uptake outer membrane protein [Chryseobacterium sp. LAM-KRS1]WBV57209.1 RagB/SusD family nutrient uptake outer membrane protein [Chryseobacterium daecheongense]